MVVFDSLNALYASAPSTANVPVLLSSFISPSASLLAIFHTDGATHQGGPYGPTPLTLLRYLATTILTTHSLHHVLARKAARDRSHAEPTFGLENATEGVVQSLGANGQEGIVLEMEHRRKSGRGVREWFFLPAHRKAHDKANTVAGPGRESITLLEDHPRYRLPETSAGGTAEDQGDGSTFELGLTDKQRRDREGVVLPYFDAQQGGGDGGRILYDMGSEDDFDEEEDEI